MKKIRLLSCVTLVFALMATPVYAAPGSMNYSGRLVDAEGAPVITPRNVKFTFWDAASDGNQLGNGYTYETTVTPNADGLYAVDMGGASGMGGPIPAAIFDAPEVWLNVNIGGEDLAPRARINSVGYAFRADEATTTTFALFANAALYATYTTNADHAANANNATTANSATSADEATHALTAGKVTTATIALTAQNSDIATTASFAQATDNADHATSADHTTSSDVSDYAGTADTSVLAQQAFGLQGSAFITVPSTGTAVQNGQALLDAYDQAKNLLPHGQPLSEQNRATLLVPSGQYDLTTGALVLDTEFVDFVGLSTARENQYIYGESDGENTGVIMQTTSSVRLENLTVECTRNSGDLNYNASDPAAYYPDTFTTNTILKNCAFRADDSNAFSMRVGAMYDGHYINCTGGNHAFGADGIANGTFTNCTGGEYAFGGGSNGIAGGTFTNCTGGQYAFGGTGGTASGTFTNCTAGQMAFGGTASGIFTNCTGGNYAFGGSYGVASGTFIHCTGGEYAFAGYYGTAAGGIFRFCSGGPFSFFADAAETSFCIKNGTPIP